MELFCALLTGFFLWLFLFHWHRAALARAREMGGQLLIEMKASQKVRRKAWGQRTLLIATGLMFLWILYLLCRSSPFRSIFDQDVVIACFFFNVLQVAFPVNRRDSPLEFRERGVVRRKQSYENCPGQLTFTPWSDISGCRWYAALPQHYVHTRFLLLDRGSVSLAEVEAINAVAGRFVPVSDGEGRLLSGLETPDDRDDATSRRRRSGGLRFQFNLQSLMLLTVVVSCAASCYGIHYRRAQPQRQAVAQFDKFHPLVYENADDVWLVDFKACAVKPGDDDLCHLKALPNLERLSLDGSPVTDAGLKHLYSLKRLTYIDLSNTKITRRGFDDLEKALPNACISCCPRPPAMTPIKKK